MNFAHCDKDEKHLTLHNCVSERAYFENGKLVFEFKDGFWISPDHPDSDFPKPVRTDFSKVEYTLEDGADRGFKIHVVKINLFNRIVIIKRKIKKLLNSINSGKCKLKFLDQHIGHNSITIECELISNKKPYYQKCFMKFSATETRYYWNNLREDRKRKLYS